MLKHARIPLVSKKLSNNIIRGLRWSQIDLSIAGCYSTRNLYSDRWVNTEPSIELGTTNPIYMYMYMYREPVMISLPTAWLHNLEWFHYGTNPLPDCITSWKQLNQNQQHASVHSQDDIYVWGCVSPLNGSVSPPPPQFTEIQEYLHVQQDSYTHTQL